MRTAISAFPICRPAHTIWQPGRVTRAPELLAANEKPKTGFPLAYYPGIPDVASASPIQLSAGQQAEADFSLTAVPVYQLSGIVTGYLPEQGVGVQVFNPSGDEVMLSTSVNMESGVIHADNVPAGSYVIKVFPQTPTQILRAETRVNVSSTSTTCGWLVLAVSIPVAVRLESRSSSSSSSSVISQDRPPVSVGLISNDTTAPESYATLVQQGAGHGSYMLQNVDSGTYVADVTPQSPWYVQSATDGQTNVDDDLSGSRQRPQLSPGNRFLLTIVRACQAR